MRSMVRKNQGSIVSFYDRAAKCQAKPQTPLAVCNGCFLCIKHLKNMWLHFFRDPGAVIVHAYLGLPGFFEPPDADDRAWRRIFYRIIDQIYQDLYNKMHVHTCKNKLFTVCHDLMLIVLPADMPE